MTAKQSKRAHFSAKRQLEVKRQAKALGFEAVMVFIPTDIKKRMFHKGNEFIQPRVELASLNGSLVISAYLINILKSLIPATSSEVKDIQKLVDITAQSCTKQGIQVQENDPLKAWKD